MAQVTYHHLQNVLYSIKLYSYCSLVFKGVKIMKLKEKLNLSDISFKKVLILAVIIAIIIICLVKFATFGTKNPNGDISGKTKLVEVTVTKVTDGDTIWVEYENYKKKVRLIGIDCPESVAYDADRNTKEGAKASDYTKSLIKKGDTVYLQTDVSDVDKYDRYLRYVWLEEPEDVNDESEIRAKMLNAIILLNGYANAKEYAPDTKYAELFKSFEEESKSAHLGLWAQ